MRAFTTIVLGLLVGWAVWYVLLGGGEGQDPPPLPLPGQMEHDREQNPHLFLTTGTLVVRIRAPDGTVPPGAQVGYVHEGRPRLAFVDHMGRCTFSDAPVGRLLVVARAPGFEEASQRRELLAGVPMEVLLTVTPTRPGGG